MTDEATRRSSQPPTTDELLERLSSGRGAAQPLPPEVFPLRTRFNGERMEDLEAAIRKPIAVPHVGEAAAQALMVCFNTTANDIVKVAQEQVDRAMLQLEEAKTLADSILSSGRIMCDRVRSEAVRGAKVSEVMRVAGMVIGETMTTDHVEGEQPEGAAAPEAARTGS